MSGSTSEDQRFLDEAFDCAYDALQQGLPIDLDALASRRPELREQVRRVSRLAADLLGAPTRDFPVIPGYEILGELGRGGMAVVYRARQQRPERLVALKVLPHVTAFAPSARRRFLFEAAAIARLKHPNIVPVYEVIEEGSTIAYAMELIDGLSLKDRLLDGPIEPREAARIGLAIARALAVAHRARLVHRDVKPSNILRRADGTPLLADFGLVRQTDSTVMTQVGSFMGTAAYSPPEQLRGTSDEVDARSDVYSLGATLFHVLVGQPPFEEATAVAILRRIEDGPPPSPRKLSSRLPRDLDVIVRKAMDPDPAGRYRSADQLADDLELYLAQRPIRARPPSLAVRAAKFARRNRGVVTAASIAGVLALAVAVVLTSVPRWSLARWRHAQTLLLDSNQIERVRIWVLRRERPSAPNVVNYESLGRALDDYRAAIWMGFGRGEIRLERDTVLVARSLATGPQEVSVPRSLAGLPMTARYAVGWSTPGPPAVVDPIPAGADPVDLRHLGLLALLCGDAGITVRAWEQLNLIQQPDPFVEALLGQLYLVNDERGGDRPELAWGLLRSAVEHFPEADHLWVHLADASLRCGRVEEAKWSLGRCRREIGGEHLSVLRRVEAELLAASGDLDGAIERYEWVRQHSWNPAMRDSYARLLIRLGRLREAAEVHGELTLLRPDLTEFREAFVSTVQMWWSSLDAAGRSAVERAIVGGDVALLEVLRLYERRAAPPADATEPEARASLLALATRLGVSDTARWIRRAGHQDDDRATIPEATADPLTARYRVAPIEPPESGWHLVFRGMNGWGDFALEGRPGDSGGVRGYMSSGEALRPLGCWPGLRTYPRGIDHLGNVVGIAGQSPALWQGDLLIELPAPSGYVRRGGAVAIGPDGTIVGRLAKRYGDRPPFWSACWKLDDSGHHQATVLPGDPPGLARDVNAHGLVVGTAGPGRAGPVMWQLPEGRMTRLPTLGGDANAVAVNDAGLIVGWAKDSGGARHAVFWQDGQITDLGLLGGTASTAGDVLSSGCVLGNVTITEDESWPFLYHEGRVAHLRDAIVDADRWTRISAVAMNDAGLIAAYADTGPDRQVVLLTPDPSADAPAPP